MFGLVPKLICTKCGSKKPPVYKTRGNLLIEIILWLCLIIPGLLYSIWRQSTKFKVCQECGNPDVIPLNSPIGKRVDQDLHGTN